MRTSLKIGLLPAVVMFSISSCSSCGHKEGQEPAKIDSPEAAIDTTQKTIDTAKKAATDTVKKDGLKK